VPSRDGGIRLLNLRGGFFALDAAASCTARALVEGGHGVAVTEEVRSLARELEGAGLLEAGSDGSSANPTLGDRISRGLVTFVRPSPEPETFGRRLLPVLKLALAATNWECAVELCAAAIRRDARRTTPAATKRGETLAGLDRVARRVAARSTFRAECKERALLFWTLAGRLGVAVELVVGVRLYPLEGHCWCEDGGVHLSDDATRCMMFRPIRRYRISDDGRLDRETVCAWASP